MKIGFLTRDSVRDKKAWSGLIYKLYVTLESIYGNSNIVPIQTKLSVGVKLYVLLFKVMAKICHKRFLYYETQRVAKCLGKSIDSHLLQNMDVIFAPASSPDFVYGKIDKPIIYLSDTTFKSICNYYPEVSNLWAFNERSGNKIEQKALNKAMHIILASDWAKNSAINDYHISPSKISVIEFGANIEEHNRIPASRSYKTGEALNVLFLGVDWERKGGEIAIDCCRILNERRIKTILHIVGIRNLKEQYRQSCFVVDHGFLNKNRPEEYKQLIEIINVCHILLLPTKAECAGIAFAESSAFGLPIFTYDTGGISNYVKNGVNGYRLNIQSKGEDFADKIIECIKKEKLVRLQEGCYQMYQERLNWNIWKLSFVNLMNKLFPENKICL